MTRLSLCLITRDEEDLLEGCLASATPFVDEVVVVDTGSRDRTLEVARRFGAVVLEQPWADDFSAPRNLALARATGDWVLQLDADERLTADGGRRLVAALDTQPSFVAALLPLHNAQSVDAPHAEVVAGTRRLGEAAWLLRLFRRTPTVRYRGVVHESVVDSLALEGRPLVKLPGVDLVHLGAAPAFRARRGKAERNLRLLRKRCELEPDDPLPFGYLALELVKAGQRPEAEAVVRQAWPLVARAPAHRPVLRLGVARGLLQLAAVDAEGLFETVAAVRTHDGPHPDLDFLEGCAHELRAQRSAFARPEVALAAQAYGRCLEGRWAHVTDSFVEGSLGWNARVRLGTMKLILDDFEGASACFAACLDERAAQADAHLGLVEAELGLGRPAEALRRVQARLDEGAPDGWLLAAAAAVMLCAPGDARLFRSKALAAGGPARVLAPHRAALFQLLEQALGPAQPLARAG